MEVLRSFTQAHVETEAIASGAGIVQKSCVLQGLTSRGQGEARVVSRVAEAVRVFDVLAQFKAAHLAGEARGEPAGVESRDPVDAAFALNLAAIERVGAVA